MRDGIDWQEVGSGGRFEKIVGVLLSTLHPESRRIDGAGGDGGRDHEMYLDGKLVLWQDKYFLDRISGGGRKRQITESLRTAAARQPDEWELVTPLVPTPEELKWLDAEAAKYPFKVTWRGGDWLEGHLKDHPSIIRHFMGPKDAYVQLVRELNEERDATVDGVAAAVPRMRKLVQQINDSNPFYKVALSFDSDGELSGTEVFPKYAGAELDSPITISFQVVAERDADGDAVIDSLRNALDWGDEAELPATHIANIVVDGPHGLAERSERAHIVLSRRPEDVQIPLKMTVWSSAGARLASLPAKMVSRVGGQRGVTITGQDHSGCITVQLRLDEQEGEVSLTLHFNAWPPSLPGPLVPVLRFMQHLTPVNLLSFDLDGANADAAVPIPDSLSLPGVEDFLRFIESLEYVQGATATYFEVPSSWSRLDELELRRAERLLRGERVRVGRGSVDFTVGGEQASEMIARAGGGRMAIALDASKNYEASICGQTIDLGPCSYYLQDATLQSLAIEGTTHRQLSAVPNGQHGLEVGLGRLQHQPGEPAVE